MGLFSKDELLLIDSLATGKPLSNPQKDLVVGVKEKLGVTSQAEVPERFVLFTGWSNRPKDYPA